jgi:hypothetical protein
MRAIHIDKLNKAQKRSIVTREKHHSICLGNGLTCYFTNEKKARTFLAETNRFLNQKVLELNRIYVDLWSEQRSMYLVFFKAFSTDQKLRQFAANIEKSLDMVMTRSHYTNGNTFTFKYFYNVMDNLREWNDYLIVLLKGKNRFYNVYNLEIISQRLGWLKSVFDTWGKEYWENRPNCFYDNTGNQ